MSFAALALSSLLPFHLSLKPPRLQLPFHHTAPEVSHTYGLEGWVFSIRTDRFTGVTRCTLGTVKPGTGIQVRYVGNALAFRFFEQLDTLNAWYRVDDQPARPWQSAYPTLVRTGVQLENGSLDNPTGGEVIVPLEELAGAREITIQPAPRAKTRTFRLKGFPQALESARVNGCRPDSSFAR